jgi:hypothetical protein
VKNLKVFQEELKKEEEEKIKEIKKLKVFQKEPEFKIEELN